VKVPRQLAIWGTTALLSLAGLGLAMRRQNHEMRSRIAVQVAATPVTGSAVFREKGCANCHGVSGAGTKFGPSLRNSRSLTSLPRLVIAMWNHAPHMWQEMEAKQLPYPALSHAETSQLMTYLYISGYVDDGGDPERGERLFAERKCAECHRRQPTSEANDPSLTDISDAEDPLSWTQTLWNHAVRMQAKMQSSAMSWPKLQGSDMRDLFAYVRQVRNLPGDDPPNVSGDPDHGWMLFQQKGCIRCHSLSPEASRLGPDLGADRPLPPTFSEFGAALLNHVPNMETAMELQKLPFPRFENHDVADIAVFLYSLHYLEPTGSPQVGKSLFAWRGCDRCHGDDGEGTSSGPALRGRGHAYTAVRLATALWAHGGRMYVSARKQEQPWPTLQDSDIGHLLTFLNTSAEQ
jgi:mono/diheme cytochrome c family protein